MSSEPVKIEVDCAVTTYSHHHHHHHHHHPSHHHHLHHATHIEEDEEEDDEFIDEDEDEDEVFMNGTTNSVVMNHHNLDESSSSEEDRSSNDSGGGSSNNSDNTEESQQQFQCATSNTTTASIVAIDAPAAPTTTNYSDTDLASPSCLTSLTLSTSSSNRAESSKSDDEEVEDDEDGECVDDGEEGDNEDEIVEEDDDEDDVDEDDDEDGSENDSDILDPVGHQQYQQLTMGSKDHTVINNLINESSPITATTNSFNHFNNSDDDDADDNDCEDDEDDDEGDDEDDDDDDDDEDDDDDDDISFDGTCDENTTNLNESSTSPDLVDGERMLEVTRKLVRSTERDPDRDLRKQVLLKTAIRKLPHFMEYNRYSDSFEQNFQLHSNNNTAVNCLTPNQYYDHHHHIHLNHIDQQPKSYYHSVQPNAIQMSTTSLRMLDLNDDQESDATNIETENPQSSYNNIINNNNDGSNDDNNISQTSLDHMQQHDYANPQTTSSSSSTPLDSHYDQYNNQLENNGPQTHSSSEHNHLNQQNELAIHDLSPYNHHHDSVTSRTSAIERHTTLDNLYQPMNGSDMSEDMKRGERTSVFQTACESYDYGCLTDDNGEKKLLNDLDANNMMNRIGHPNDSYQNHLTTVNAYYTISNETTTTTTTTIATRTPMKEIESNSPTPTTTTDLDSSLRVESVTVEGTTSATIDSDLILDGSGGSSESGSSNSSQSSTVSNESVNSSTSQSNDSIDGPSNSSTSILETSLNSTSDFYHDLHDSGVALYSPRSNKRSSSSIGLDDEMEVDHLSDLNSSASAQSNSCLAGAHQNINQYKKLRKRELMD